MDGTFGGEIRSVDDAIEALKNPRRALPDAAKSARRPGELS